MQERHDYRALAERQHGLVTSDQLERLDITDSSARHRCQVGSIQFVGRRTLRIAGSVRTDEQAALAAVFDAGFHAALSHGSAAALWGLPGFSIRPVDVTVPRGSMPTGARLARVHRVRAFAESHRTVLDGIPVVRPELLALQICGSLHPGRAERALDNLWSKRLLSGPSTRRVLDEVAASGVRGVRLLRQLLDDRGPRYVPPASSLEARFARILRDSGEPPMERQVDLGDAQQWCGRVDFADPPSDGPRALMEVDSERYHSALVDRRADAARERRLLEAGFVLGRVTDVQVWHHPVQVLAEVRRIRGLVRMARRPR
jgi:very-short-patch-repair endonuclease